MKKNTSTKKIMLPRVYTIDNREIAAAVKVLKEGPLSGFVGLAGDCFLGGPVVRRFEKTFAKKFKTKHAVTFNSATTALHGAIVALGIGPGDEVILPPYTMSATATAILMNGAVPIFADIDERTFCIDPASVEKNITKRTKAIMVVNLFGQPADFEKLLRIAKKYKLKIIEDNAQSPGALWHGKYAGTIGDIGVFSFNVHKMIQAGEGGVLVTNNDKYALRAQLCRNHGESVVVGIPHYDGGPIFGSNYRMTEIVAAVAEVQLARLDFLNKKRLALVAHLTKGLQKIPGMTIPYVPPDTKNVFYTYAIKIDEKKLSMTRSLLAAELVKRGFPVGAGYVKPLYLLSLFQEKKAFNGTHFPFESNYYDGNPDYSRGICPTTERMHYTELLSTSICQYPYTKKHVDLFLAAITEILAAHRK